MLNQPFGHIRSHLDAVHDGLDVQRCLVKNLGGTTDSLLTYSCTSLIEQEAKGTDEDECSKDNHPQADPDGKFPADICYYSVHALLCQFVVCYFALNHIILQHQTTGLTHHIRAESELALF